MLFPPRASARFGLCASALVLLCAAVLLLLGIFAPLDHDEGQYVGAVALMPDGLPFRDFAYLQTPLQPLLFAPLAWLAKGWLFLALRATNALLAAGAVACLALAARRAGASPRATFLAAAALFFSHMLLFAGTVARNDALPLLLCTAGLALAIQHIQQARPVGEIQHPNNRFSALTVGLLFGLSASAKLNYAFPAAAIGLFALTHWRLLGPANVALIAIGGLLGIAPTLALAAIAPDAAWFGIIDYGLKAPVEWRVLNGQAFMLAWPLSLARMARFLAEGCGLIALAATLAAIRRKRSPVDCLLDMMILAGLIAAWLPRPIYVQYLGPLLPPLLLRFALLSDSRFWRSGGGRLLILASLVSGMVQTGLAASSNLARGRSPVLTALRDAQAARHIITQAGIAGSLASLSPASAVDIGMKPDRRFVAGPFLFRTQRLLTEDRAKAFHVTTPGTLSRDFAASPPMAILVGAENEASPVAPHGLDAALIAWSTAHHYRRHDLPSREAALFIAPTN